MHECAKRRTSCWSTRSVPHRGKYTTGTVLIHCLDIYRCLAPDWIWKFCEVSEPSRTKRHADAFSVCAGAMGCGGRPPSPMLPTANISILFQTGTEWSVNFSFFFLFHAGLSLGWIVDVAAKLGKRKGTVEENVSASLVERESHIISRDAFSWMASAILSICAFMADGASGSRSK